MVRPVVAVLLLTAAFILTLGACARSAGSISRFTEPDAELPLGFPADFPALTDSGGNGAGEQTTGFGGSRDDRSAKRPVILIHGNGTPAQEIWRHYRQWLLDSGYRSGDVWALNYLGERGGAEGETPFRDNIADVRLFVDAVIDYLEVDRVDIVAVSLGCHLARGYVLGARFGEDSDGEIVFDPSLRRADRVRSMVLISGANYGLGTAIADPDWNTESELFSMTAENSFFEVDGVEDHTPFSDQIHYATVAAEFDYPETLYRLSDRPAAAWRTSSLEGAVNQIVGPDEGLGYPDSRTVDSNFANHRRLVRDPFVFATYVLAHLNRD